MTRPFAAEAAACRKAQESWSRQTVRQRVRLLREVRFRLVERCEDLCRAAAGDIGRPIAEVIGTELLPAAAALKFLERNAPRVLAPRSVSAWQRPAWLFDCRDVVLRRPWGVVGIIGTWNYPIYLNVGQIAQALAAGNGVLWKPSENAPRTAALTHQLFLDSGIPSDLFVMLPATREGGSQLAETAVDHVVFTGSDAVGRKLAARLGERLVPSTLELSGCDAMFVLDDADIPLAAKAAWFGMTLNRGQTCIAVRRIFVPRAKMPAFVDALRPLVEAAARQALLAPGQVEQARRLAADAVNRGATVLSASAGDNPGADLRMPPTVLLEVPADAAICREAAFAPIAAVIPFDSIDDALSQAAESPFGLAASIFSSDARRARELAASIPAGSVAINDVIAPTAHPGTPFGGRGASGWGVCQGPEGLLAMTVPQVVSVRRGRFRPHFEEAARPDPRTTGILRGLLRATHGRRWRDIVAGCSEMWRALRKKG